MVWVVLWFLLVADSPDTVGVQILVFLNDVVAIPNFQHRYISAEEKKHIMESIGKVIENQL